MHHSQLLHNFLKLQEAVVFDRLIELPFATIGYSKKDTSVYWNFALVQEMITNVQIKELEENFVKLSRDSTITFENKEKQSGLESVLIDQRYKKTFEDSWLFYEQELVDKTHFDSVVLVKNEEDLRIFLTTFDACYQKNDQQNPYGELGKYLIMAKDTWFTNESKRLCYFTVFDNQTPVAVSTLNSSNGIGYISNVGSVLRVRGKGFGKAATLYAVQESLRQGNKQTFLITEEGTYPHEFYKRLGFVKKLSTLGYTKTI